MDTVLNGKNRVGFGGGCHWCTEAIFQAVQGVIKVEQGWIKSKPPHDLLSEGVIIHFDDIVVDLSRLIRIHLHTHSSTSKHTLRHKYRSAIYTYRKTQQKEAEQILEKLSSDFASPIITQVLPLAGFKLNQESYLNYYLNNPEKQFCQRYIEPKLKKINQIT